MKFFAHVDGQEFEMVLSSERNRLQIRSGSRSVELILEDHRGAIQTAHIGNRLIEFGWIRKDGLYRIQVDGVEYEVLLRDPKSEQIAKVTEAQLATEILEVRAPIPGLIKEVLLSEGAPVRKDQPVLYLDAMKLENEIPAPRDGILKSVAVRPGQAVEKGQVLFVVE